MKQTAREVMDDNVLGLGAQTAYYFFFSLFPIFLFLAPLLSLVGDKRETFTFLLEKIQGAVPQEAYALVVNVVESVVFAENAPGLVSVGALLALWSGSNVFSALMDALNTAYDIPKDPRPYWKKKLIALACLIGVGGLFVFATITMLAGGDIVDAIAEPLGIGAVGRWVWAIAQYAIALGLLVASGWAVYYYLPAIKQHKHHALVGALVTTALWLIVTLGFRAYVQNFGSYNKTYGTIGGVIVLLTWMYLSMVVLLIGGEVASELQKGTGALRSRAGHLYDGRIATGGPTDRASVDAVESVPPTPPRARPERERPAPSSGHAPRAAFVARPPRAD
ncbi:YihY/virulence factor BrkB family protein [Roseisolibacter sp. H3M3-2]|nr:YihY/virulence factor BrkB family protein [Roseisolibacter sp. H3M3-2]